MCSLAVIRLYHDKIFFCELSGAVVALEAGQYVGLQQQQVFEMFTHPTPQGDNNHYDQCN